MAAINDSIQAKGKLNIVVTGPDGKVKQDLLVPNLVVMYGKNYIAKRMVAASTPNEMQYMSIGQVSDSYGLNATGTTFGTANTVATGNGNNFAAYTWQQSLAAEVLSERVTATRATGTTAVTTVGTTLASSNAGPLVVSSGTGIAVGMYIHHPAIPALTKVATSYAGGGATSIPLDFSATSGPATTTLAYAINAPVVLASTTGNSGEYKVTVSANTNIQVGMRVTGTNIGRNAYVYAISGTTIYLTTANTAAVNTTVTFDNPIYFTNANTVTYTATFYPTSTGSGGSGTNLASALVEAGIFNDTYASTTYGENSQAGGSMLCRTVFPVVNKGVDDTMTITWTVTIQ